MTTLDAGVVTSGSGVTFHVWRASTEDRDRVGQLLKQHWPAWQGEIDVALANRPVSLHVAQPDSKTDLVAFAAYDANNRGTGWFGPMGTAPEWEGHGLGRILLLRCLEDIRQQGHPKAIIPWVGPVGFYHAAVGAQVSRVFMRMEKAL
jgi:GNAT superfamily N-acetyltransferase